VQTPVRRVISRSQAGVRRGVRRFFVSDGVPRASRGGAKLCGLFGHSAEAQEAACDVGARAKEVVERVHCGVFSGLRGLRFADFTGDG